MNISKYKSNLECWQTIIGIHNSCSHVLCHHKLEDMNIFLPVTKFKIKYLKPSFYDDLLSIETTINEIPKKRINFNYKTFNQNNCLINKAEVELAFVNGKDMKPCFAPKILIKKLELFFV